MVSTDDIFKTLSREIGSRVTLSEEQSVDFSHLGYTTYPFSSHNFHSIPDIPATSRTCFIDGGDAGLFSSSSLSLSFIRIFHSVYKENKRSSFRKDEFFCLVFSEKRSGRLVYSAKLFPKGETFLSSSFFEGPFVFDPSDPSLSVRKSRISISHIPGVIRRFAELSTALLLARSLSSRDSIVLDGSFECKLDGEERLVRTLKNISDENSVIVSGLSKTSNLLTSDGQSPVLALNSKAPSGAWFYFPVADAPFHLYFVKLHESSDYIFRLDLLSSKDASSLLSSLKKNSVDPVFLGYPYGLVEADRFARVSNQEKEYLKTSFLSRSDISSEKLRVLSKSLDAHSVLDNIS